MKDLFWISLEKPTTKLPAKPTGYVPLNKTPRQEAPVTSRAPAAVATAHASPKKSESKQVRPKSIRSSRVLFLCSVQDSSESLTPRPIDATEVTPRDPTLKNTDDRYREALQKFRTDRAEQQQRDLVTSAALSLAEVMFSITSRLE